MSEHGGPFKKGDPRINRKGRPRSFDALRQLAQQIAHEAAMSGGQPVIISGHKVTIAEAILRSWATSKNPQLARAFIEIAYGKVPDVHEVSGKMDLASTTSQTILYIPDNLRDKKEVDDGSSG
jgi:hypothetical protein